MKPILEIQNIGKKFKIQHEHLPYLSLRDSLKQVFKKSRSTEDFWALQDISFDVMPGDSIGIIGKNGAGKSTLLKILSKITPPTKGQIIGRGRIASLLEVGTGFHPELSGRDNIFMNGSILGMKRFEIAKNFDAIVDFSGVERFLDEPLKHYSSGMQLRLAFAVAAFLENEILIIDEVLAVGDAEFQKKCMGKMDDVSKSGRTILFVSHDLAAIRSLTRKAALLNNGNCIVFDDTEEVIKKYSENLINKTSGIFSTSGNITKIHSAKIISLNIENRNKTKKQIELIIGIDIETNGQENTSFELILKDSKKQRIGLVSSYQFHQKKLPSKKGLYSTTIEIEPLNLASGEYFIDITTSIINQCWDHYIEDALSFNVSYSNPLGYSWDFKQDYNYGTMALLLKSEPKFVLNDK
jgi:lipopolysaccharide transport system ATP-binding protein